MSFTIDLSREIAAPAWVVWEVITDLPAYPEWNPFVIGCESTLVPGQSIHMRVKLLPWITQSQTETVFENVALERICYGIERGPVRSRRCHQLRAIAVDRTRYDSHFRIAGPLAGLTRRLLGSRLRQGFEAMTEALARRAEQMAQLTR